MYISICGVGKWEETSNSSWGESEGGWTGNRHERRLLTVYIIYIYFLNHVNKTKPTKEKKKKGNICSKKMLTGSGPLIWREKNA